jgi:hypothetical protein
LCGGVCLHQRKSKRPVLKGLAHQMDMAFVDIYV